MTHEYIDVDHIASLCRIELTDEEKSTISQQLDTMLTYLEQLNEINVDNVPSMLHPLDQFNVLREDAPGENFSIEDVLKNVPESKNNQVAVPKIVD